MLQWQPLRAIEIDYKLRDDSRRMLTDYGIVTQQTDPILAVLFHSLALQIEEVYEHAAESIPLAIIDDLIVGLGIPERRSLPAQAVVRLSLQEGRERFAEGTELIGQLASREKLAFALDASVEVSPAEISLVAVYQYGLLRLHHGTELSKELEDARPSFEPVQAELGPNPAIFIGIDVHDLRHLSNHGFYFELIPEAKDLRTYLQRESWCLLDDEGEIQAKGMLRSRAGNAGVRRLEWLVKDSALSEGSQAGLLPEGFYGGRVFIFPEVPAERRFLTNIGSPGIPVVTHKVS